VARARKERAYLIDEPAQDLVSVIARNLVPDLDRRQMFAAPRQVFAVLQKLVWNVDLEVWL
jgi:hypothetical protein